LFDNSIDIFILFSFLSFKLIRIMFFRTIYKENIKLALETLSITGNTTKYEEVNIEWLKGELQQADDIIVDAKEWIDKCKDTIKL